MKNISHKTQNTCVNCGAFTVVELLVMIGTIAVMGTLLMSAMAGVRPRGGVIQCLQNTRRIMLGMQMYASDWQDTLPNSGWDPLTPCWVTATGWPVGGSATALTFDVFLRGQLNFVRQGQLWPYMKTEKILMCPQDKVDTMFYNRGIYFSTYVWNGAVNQYASTPHWNACKISNASLKSTHIVQWENDEKLATPGSGNWIDCANWPFDSCSERHSLGGTVGRLDGSAAQVARGDFFKWAGCTVNSSGHATGNGSKAQASPVPGPLWWWN